MSKSIIKTRKLDYKKVYKSLEDQQFDDKITQNDKQTSSRASENIPQYIESNSSDKISANIDYQNSQLNELNSKLIKSKYQTNTQFIQNSSYQLNPPSKQGKPSNIQKQNNSAFYQSKDKSSRQQSYKNLHQTKTAEFEKQNDQFSGDTTFHTAIQILKKNISKGHQVEVLEKFIRGEDDLDNFEEVIRALNEAAKEYLLNKDKQKAMQIINFSYETCIIEKVQIELQAETMLNYCQIAKKNKEYNSSIQIIHKCINLYQDHPLLINIGVAYNIYSQILRKQNKLREALEMAKKAIFYSEQKCKLLAKRNGNSDIQDEYAQNLENELQIQIAAAYYNQALCEATLLNKKNAIALIQSAIVKVSQILGQSNPITIKYAQKLKQISSNQQNNQEREERTFSGYQSETIYSNTSSFNKKNNSNQVIGVTFNENINDEYNSILYNKSNKSINQHLSQNNDLEETRNLNNIRQRPGSSSGISQTLRIQTQQQRPQSGKSNLGKKLFISKRSLLKNKTNDQISTLKNLLKQDQLHNETKPFMYQDFSYISPTMVQKNNLMTSKSIEAEFFQESKESQYVDKIRFLSETVKSLQQDIEKLKRQNGYLQIKIFDHENSNSKVIQTNKQVNHLNIQIEDMQKRFNELKEKNEKCEKEHFGEIDKLQSALRDRSEVLKKVLENSQQEVQKYEERIQKLMTEQEKKQRQVNDQICTFELTNSKNQLQINTLKSQIQEMIESHAVAQQNKDKEIQKLNSSLQQQEEHYSSELQKYQKNQQEISEQVKKTNQLELELKKLKEEKELVDQALFRYRNQTTDLTEETSSLQQKLSEANTESKSKDVVIEQLQEKLKVFQNLKEQLTDNSKANDELQKEKKDLNSQLNRIQEENKRLQNLLQDAQKDNDEKEKLLEIQKNINKTSEINQEETLKQENNKLKEKLSILTNENEQLKAQLQGAIIDRNQDKILIAQLQLDIKETEEKYRDLEQNVNLMKKNNATFNDIRTKQIYSDEDDESHNDLQIRKSINNLPQEQSNINEQEKNLDDSIANIQNSLNVNKNKKILILQQFDNGFNALIDFSFHCQNHILSVEKKGEHLITINIHQDILQVFYTSKNFFIFSKILRRFAANFLQNSNGQIAEEFIFDVDEMTFKYAHNQIKYENSYIKHMIQQLPEQVIKIFSEYSFFSNEASDQKLIELSQKKITESEVKEKKTISFGEAMVNCDQLQEKVPVKFIYDVKKQVLNIQPANPQIQGMRVSIKKEDTQQWIVQNKLISLDKQIRAIKMEHVRFLKSSIKRYHLVNRVFSTYISLSQYDQKVHGILTIFKGIQNSFVYIKTLHKEQNYKSFYQISMNDKSFEKLKEISKQYIIDQCQFNYSKGIIWMKKDLGIINIYPNLTNVIHTDLIKITQEEIFIIRQKKGLKDENFIRDESSDTQYDTIQIVVKIVDNQLIVQPLWDLPIAPLHKKVEPTQNEEQIKELSKILVQKIKVDYDTQKNQLCLILNDQINNSECSKQKPSNIYKLDCLNKTLRKTRNNINTAHLAYIDVIEVPDHTAKSTCKLQILLNTRTNEYLIRSYLKQVHEIKIPAHNLSKEKLLNLYYFYYEQNTIKYLRKQILEKVIFQMRRFKIMNKLKFYQIKTKAGQYGDLILFQGIKSTMIILKIMFQNKKDQVRKLFVIQETNLEHIIENINEIIQLLNQHIVNIYLVLSYRQVENQEFQFYSIAALWDQHNKEIILKPDDLSIPPVIFKKPKLSYRQALFQGEELLEQAILYKDPQTGLNRIDI
ncbi:hypothetical protein TTHERM_00703420 (macronuclear) [Tetrahymena thermophila SB210]|uniref:Tetratricopeptide repeat protein n=1 Tax=Tetrahymena thermophila (strain SB210) TaxID=312017 RepID=Q22GI1_TETTS|nr:hypothetical protein TTHERM_00703420 [Tetrahymena thermophila SB210]EAR84350.2 hypothetical protein TTHERM_00703420 [Tetrahymena thermophila SB210]|eukprot:XP_001032013.2 hypothetical protein TTHERM_00703420 [Tetrahymena thermophila SB210]